MTVEDLPLPGLRLVQLDVLQDSREFFVERFNQDRFRAAGAASHFAQDNHSHSLPGVIRGLHYQYAQPQGKLVGVIRGRVWDVAVDIRAESPMFGQHYARELSAANIIMDNYSTHKTALIRNWFAKRPRFHVHFTPTYGSWLSLVERWFAELTMKQIRRGPFRSGPQLKAAIQAFIDADQADPRPFVWTKSVDEILASIARFRPAHRRRTGRATNVTNHGYRTLAIMWCGPSGRD